MIDPVDWKARCVDAAWDDWDRAVEGWRDSRPACRAPGCICASPCATYEGPPEPDCILCWAVNNDARCRGFCAIVAVPGSRLARARWPRAFNGP